MRWPPTGRPALRSTVRPTVLLPQRPPPSRRHLRRWPRPRLPTLARPPGQRPQAMRRVNRTQTPDDPNNATNSAEKASRTALQLVDTKYQLLNQEWSRRRVPCPWANCTQRATRSAILASHVPDASLGWRSVPKSLRDKPVTTIGKFRPRPADAEMGRACLDPRQRPPRSEAFPFRVQTQPTADWRRLNLRCTRA